MITQDIEVVLLGHLESTENRYQRFLPASRSRRLEDIPSAESHHTRDVSISAPPLARASLRRHAP